MLSQVQTREADIDVEPPCGKLKHGTLLLLFMLVDSPTSSKVVNTSGRDIVKPPAGRLEHIREGFRKQGLPEQATSLIDKSGLRQTGLTAHSSSDEITGVVRGISIHFWEVANFLASLFEEGYHAV